MSDTTPHERREHLALEVFARQEAAELAQSMEYLRDHGRDAIKGLFLLNGGAIAGLLTFLGAMFAKSDSVSKIAVVALQHLGPSFKFFVTGAAISVFMSGIGYLNWSAVAALGMNSREMISFIRGDQAAIIKKKAWLGPFTTFTARMAVIMSVASLGCFALGVWSVLGGLGEIERVMKEPSSTPTGTTPPRGP